MIVLIPAIKRFKNPLYKTLGSREEATYPANTKTAFVMKKLINQKVKYLLVINNNRSKTPIKRNLFTSILFKKSDLK